MLDEVEGLFVATGRVLAPPGRLDPGTFFLVGHAETDRTLRNSASSGQALRPPTFFSGSTDRRKLSLGALSIAPSLFHTK